MYGRATKCRRVHVCTPRYTRTQRLAGCYNLTGTSVLPRLTPMECPHERWHTGWTKCCEKNYNYCRSTDHFKNDTETWFGACNFAAACSPHWFSNTYKRDERKVLKARMITSAIDTTAVAGAALTVATVALCVTDPACSMAVMALTAA